MADLIDRQALLEKVRFDFEPRDISDIPTAIIRECVNLTRKFIMDMPTIDAVEVVRCDAYNRVYPLTIVLDRYGGTYSGGRFTAWNRKPKGVPEDVYGNDLECMTYWGNNSLAVCGIGDTPEAAVTNLFNRLTSAQNRRADNA